MNRTLFLIVAIIFFAGCANQNRSKQSTDREIYFDYEEYIDKFDIGALTDSTFQIIPLETNDTCLIANIDKIEIRNNRIFIMDELTQSVYVFDMTGKFLNKIYARGQGPGEYTNLSYMTVTDSFVLVIDHFTSKQIKYDAFSMKMLNEEQILDKIWCMDLFALHGNIYYVNDCSDSNSGKFRLFKRDSSNEIYKYLPFEEAPALMDNIDCYYGINGNEALIIYNGNDTIYRLDEEGEVYPKYVVKFQNKRVVYTSKEYNAIISAYFNSPSGCINGIAAIHESDKYLFFDVNVTVEKNQSIGPGNYSCYTCIYNKQNYKTIIYPHQTFNSKCDSEFSLDKYRIIDNKLIAWEVAPELLYYGKVSDSKKTFENKEFTDRLKNVIANIKDDDNPVLFVYNLK